MGLHSVSRELTSAGLCAFDPRVLNVRIAGTSTVLIPSATGSATTDSTGFLEGAALGTRHCRSGWRGSY